MIKQIHVFDFDGTLFNSPLKPEGWKGGWWGRSHSLLPPFVPHHRELKEKGAHLLNDKVVTAFLASKKKEDVHTVMMTGRHWGIRHEVLNILQAFDLCSQDDRDCLQEKDWGSKHFIFISGNKTLEGKLEKLTGLYKEFSDVDWIEMWEDRQEHIPHFRAHADVLQKIRPFEGIMVHEPPDWD